MQLLDGLLSRMLPSLQQALMTASRSFTFTTPLQLMSAGAHKAGRDRKTVN
jgi:hypothetical protein